MVTDELLTLEAPKAEEIPSLEEREALREKVFAIIARRAQKPLGAEHYDVALVHGHPVQLKLTAQQRARATRVGAHLFNAEAMVFASDYIKLETAVHCVTVQMESGGRMIYGADPASSWMNRGPFGTLWQREVTHANFEWFWAAVVKGAASNGVGLAQLTSPSLIAAANKRGGAWVAEHNSAEGCEFFLELLHQTGSLWLAFYHYNGSGSAAQRYANDSVALCGEWRGRGVNK